MGRHATDKVPPDPSGAPRFEFMLNQRALKQLNLGDDPIGKELDFNYDEGEPLQGIVVGVVEDFHFKPLYHEIKPLVLVSHSFSISGFGHMAIRITSDDVPRTMTRIQDRWQEFAGDWPLDYMFLDRNYEALYSAEEMFGKLIGLFTIILIVISSLGIFALSSLVAEQRVKELGIRKALVASVSNLVVLLTRLFKVR